jgi:hypothetical protein
MILRSPARRPPRASVGEVLPRSRSTVAMAVAAVALLGVASGCSAVETAGAPHCTDPARLAVVAQSVPGAAYVPCLAELPTGWEVTHFEPSSEGTELGLLSDRADDREVAVQFRRYCDVRGASPQPPRTVGGRTYLRVDSILPRYSGRLLDVFPGGCVTYDVDFERGPHIALMEELRSAVSLVPRRELRLRLRHELGQELDP